MCYADALGLGVVLAGIRELAQQHGSRYWTPAPLLVELAERGDTFQIWQEVRRQMPWAMTIEEIAAPRFGLLST
jgi:hypothetical protein